MGDAGNRYNLANQPDGVERIWKALERLGRKATGGVPSFANNTELKFWLAAVGGRHEVHGDRPKADAYARCLENLGIAVMSESHGLLIDLKRVAQLRDYRDNQVLWNERDDEALAVRTRQLEQSIALAEQGDADAEDVDETVVNAKAVEPAPKPESPVTDAVAVKPAPPKVYAMSHIERLAAAVARLEELRAKEVLRNTLETRLKITEYELEQLDGELINQRTSIKKLDGDIVELETNLSTGKMSVERAQIRVSALQEQLEQARVDLESETTAQSRLEGKMASAINRRAVDTKGLQDAENHYKTFLEAYEVLERQRDGATLSDAEREEIGRIERALEVLNDLNV